MNPCAPPSPLYSCVLFLWYHSFAYLSHLRWILMTRVVSLSSNMERSASLISRVSSEYEVHFWFCYSHVSSLDSFSTSNFEFFILHFPRFFYITQLSVKSFWGEKSLLDFFELRRSKKTPHSGQPKCFLGWPLFVLLTFSKNISSLYTKLRLHTWVS